MSDGHNERTHRRYSPSQAERFLACPGSTALLAKVPVRETSPAAAEGTQAHEILQFALTNGIRNADVACEESVYCLETFSEGYRSSLQDALDYVYDILDEYPDAKMYVETYVDPPCPPAPGEAAGYCDIAIHIPSIQTLYVIDYKHGQGVAKDVGPQPKQYAAGFIYQENPLVDPQTLDNIVLVIVQPRAFHRLGPIRELALTPYEVYEYLGELEDAVTDAESGTAALVPGDHCHNTFCDARTVCPARERMALQKTVGDFANVRGITEPTLPVVENISIDRLVYIAQAAPMLREFLTDVENHIKELLMSGHDVPGFRLAETEARRSWFGDDNDIAFKLAALAGADVSEFLRTSLITITDAEKKVTAAFKKRVSKNKKNQAAEDAKKMVAMLTLKQSSGALKVVPSDDPAPMLNRAEKQFAAIPQLAPPPQNT